MLQIIGNNNWSTLANINEKNKDTPNNIGGKSVGRDIKNLLSIVKLTKFKKPNFVITNSSKASFLIFGAKEAFIYL